jgi:glycyl-tRNA synthetase (class II)
MRKVNIYEFKEKTPDLGKAIVIIPKEKEKKSNIYYDFYIGKVYDVIQELKDELTLTDDPEAIEDLKKTIKEREDTANQFKIEWLDEEGCDYSDTDVNDILDWEWIEIR